LESRAPTVKTTDPLPAVAIPDGEPAGVKSGLASYPPPAGSPGSEGIFSSIFKLLAYHHRTGSRFSALPKIAPGRDSMSARILYLGMDDCLRIPVLKGAGYAIEVCRSEAQLRAALELPASVDGVILSEIDGITSELAVSLACAQCAAPLILFAGRGTRFNASDFDLIVPALTPPTDWLIEIARLIGDTRALPPDPARPKPVAQDLSLPAGSPASSGRQSRRESGRPRRERARNSAFAARFPAFDCEEDRAELL
jgi:hypothetical protein